MTTPTRALSGVSRLAVFVGLALTASRADAQPGNGQPPGNGGPPHGMRPPQEAYDACNGRSEGASCSVSFHGNTLAGTCRQDRERALVCFPANMPAPPSQ